MMNDELWMNNKVPLTDDEEENEVKNTIQQTVSHFTSNTNKVILSIFSTKSILSYFYPAKVLHSQKILISKLFLFTVFSQFSTEKMKFKEWNNVFFSDYNNLFFRVTVGFV